MTSSDGAQRFTRHFLIDEDVTRTFAAIVAEARRLGRHPKVMDTWIAATAVVHGLPVYSQDEDFESIPQVEVVLV